MASGWSMESLAEAAWLFLSPTVFLGSIRSEGQADSQRTQPPLFP